MRELFVVGEKSLGLQERAFLTGIPDVVDAVEALTMSLGVEFLTCPPM